MWNNTTTNPPILTWRDENNRPVIVENEFYEEWPQDLDEPSENGKIVEKPEPVTSTDR